MAIDAAAPAELQKLRQPDRVSQPEKWLFGSFVHEHAVFLGLAIALLAWLMPTYVYRNFLTGAGASTGWNRVDWAADRL